jgi:hypothetical protein
MRWDEMRWDVVWYDRMWYDRMWCDRMWSCTAYLYNMAQHCTDLIVLHVTPTILYCTALHCAALDSTCSELHCFHRTAPHCTALHCTVLYCTVLLCTALQCTLSCVTDLTLFYNILRWTPLPFTVQHIWHSTALYYTISLCVRHIGAAQVPPARALHRHRHPPRRRGGGGLLHN